MHNGTPKWFDVGPIQTPGAVVAELRVQGRDQEANAVVAEELRSTIALSIHRATVESAEVQGDVI